MLYYFDDEINDFELQNIRIMNEDENENERDEGIEEENGEDDSKSESIKDKLQSIKELGVPTLPEIDERIQILPIIGQIEGHQVLGPQVKSTKYEHVLPQIFAAEISKKVEGVLIVLNTVGGDVEAGLAIAEMIRSINKPTVSLVIGGGHSIGVPLATAGKYSFICPSATMIVHPIRMNGLVIGVPQTFQYFSKMQERIINFIVETSKITAEKLKEFMNRTDGLLNDMGTILIGKEAVDAGIINEVGGIKDAIKTLEVMINQSKKP